MIQFVLTEQPQERCLHVDRYTTPENKKNNINKHHIFPDDHSFFYGIKCIIHLNRTKHGKHSNYNNNNVKQFQIVKSRPV